MRLRLVQATCMGFVGTEVVATVGCFIDDCPYLSGTRPIKRMTGAC